MTILQFLMWTATPCIVFESHLPLLWLHLPQIFIVFKIYCLVKPSKELLKHCCLKRGVEDEFAFFDVELRLPILCLSPISLSCLQWYLPQKLLHVTNGILLNK